MAGDWIKMRHDLQADPAVVRIASVLGLDSFAVVGRLHAVWGWADTHADCHGRVTLVSHEWVDSLVRTPGFARAMELVGWLNIDAESVKFPRFERHMGCGAKARAMATERKRKSRTASSSDSRSGRIPKRDTAPESGHGRVTNPSRSDRDKSVTREEKRREEIEAIEEPPNPPKTGGGSTDEPTITIPAELNTEEFRIAWGEWKAERATNRKSYTPRGEREQLRKLAAFGPAAAIAAIQDSIRQGWQGLFPEKHANDRPRSGSPVRSSARIEFDPTRNGIKPVIVCGAEAPAEAVPEVAAERAS